MKKLTFILILVLGSWSLFGQDSVKTQRNKFYVGIALNNIIPTDKSFELHYNSIVGSNEPRTYKFYFPQATFSMGIRCGYQIPILFKNHRFRIALTPDISLNYYKKNYILINDNSVNKTIFYNVALNILPTFSYSISKKSTITLYIGEGLIYNFKIKRKVTTFKYLNNNQIKTYKEFNNDINRNKNMLEIDYLIRLAYFFKVRKHQVGFFVGTLVSDEAAYIGSTSNNNRIFLKYGFFYKL